MSLLHSLSSPACQAHIERDMCSESRACGCCTTEHILDVTGNMLDVCGGECCAHKKTNTHLNVTASRYHTGTDSFSYMRGEPGGNVCFVENYFDENSECFREESISVHNLAPSGVAFGAVEMSLSEMEGVGGMAEIVAAVSSVSTKHANGMIAASDTTGDGCCGSISAGGVNIGSCDEAEDDDDGSHFGTSMLQNKKKPRSRLKKFLTSLLSLSSSSSEDENYDSRSAPSQSSNWQ